jgi:outer membrane murein-binding lipoprotein Lpp
MATPAEVQTLIDAKAVEITALDGRITAARAAHAIGTAKTLEARKAALEAERDRLQVEKDAATVTADAATNATNIGKLDTRLIVAEGELDNVEADVAGHETRITALENPK